EAGRDTTLGSENSFFGQYSGVKNTTGVSNTFVGRASGSENRKGSNNTLIGWRTGYVNRDGSNNTLLGADADFSDNLINATAIGANANATQSNSLILGSINGVNGATSDTSVGIGTTAPNDKLHVSGSGVVRVRVNSDTNAGVRLALNDQFKWSVATVTTGNFQIYNDATNDNVVWINGSTNNVGIGTTSPNDKLDVQGTIGVATLASAGSTQLCRNAANHISRWSSSLRYKKGLQPFTRGRSLLNQLKPITFKWKTDSSPDLGFGAEDIALIEPLLVTHNDKGEVEGVKYDRITAVLVNAIKEQQVQIQAGEDRQREFAKEVARQQAVINRLEKVVAVRHSKGGRNRSRPCSSTQ